MKRSDSTVVHPGLRAQRVAAFTEMGKAAGMSDDALAQLRTACTPKPLLALPDHAGRGHKSLGRIQQLTNRRRFKTRKAVSR